MASFLMKHRVMFCSHSSNLVRSQSFKICLTIIIYLFLKQVITKKKFNSYWLYLTIKELKERVAVNYYFPILA